MNTEIKYYPTVCVDFDGVLNQYTGWKGEDNLGELAEQASWFLFQLQHAGYHVVVFTTRPEEKVWKWLADLEIDGLVDDVTNVKPPAKVYVDDRAVCHRGDFLETFEAVHGFKAHWEQR